MNKWYIAIQLTPGNGMFSHGIYFIYCITFTFSQRGPENCYIKNNMKLTCNFSCF